MWVRRIWEGSERELFVSIIGKGSQGGKVAISVGGDKLLAVVVVRKAKKKVGGGYPYEAFFENDPFIKETFPVRGARMTPREMKEIALRFFDKHFRR
jgi:hypothetical protein